ncbi:MAG TPA: EndoU domain-containing protein [Micavibrio sp.]
MNRTKLTFTTLILALSALLFIMQVVKNPQGPLTAYQPALTAQAEQHLLYGDQRGGGHLHGVGKACKSEFPADWQADEVIAHVKRVAANDNLNWEQQNNGYHVAEDDVEGIKVRVVLNHDRTKIVTAYPTNVPRNPCPAKKPANDNRHLTPD